MTDEEVTVLLESIKKIDSKFLLSIFGFNITIYSYPVGDTDSFSNDLITSHDIIYVYLNELNGSSVINLEHDFRFKNYKPIKYSDIPGYSNGDCMPINNFYELIKYLFRLNKISAFT